MCFLSTSSFVRRYMQKRERNVSIPIVFTLSLSLSVCVSLSSIRSIRVASRVDREREKRSRKKEGKKRNNNNNNDDVEKNIGNDGVVYLRQSRRKFLRLKHLHRVRSLGLQCSFEKQQKRREEKEERKKERKTDRQTESKKQENNTDCSLYMSPLYTYVCQLMFLVVHRFDDEHTL
jgi:hypothetical protein